jgi:hypothetical protein
VQRPRHHLVQHLRHGAWTQRQQVRACMHEHVAEQRSACASKGHNTVVWNLAVSHDMVD